MQASELLEPAQRLAELLEQTQTQIVFAESCTAGRVAASLALLPGISRWLCGSAVTYQEQTKTQWLGVPELDLRLHSAVSPEVTLAMARGVLRGTTLADLAVAVTGHLGPQAPAALDGVVYIAALWRGEGAGEPLMQRVVLRASQREARQGEAARHVLQVSIDSLLQRKTIADPEPLEPPGG